MKTFFENGITVALFSFTPIKGTRLEALKPPTLLRYRRIQFLRYLLSKRVNFEPEFDDVGALAAIASPKSNEAIGGDFYNSVLEALQNPTIFMTSGCPNCNRPYYNETPAGPIFNYPFMPGKDILTSIMGTFIDKISENELRFKT
jgi:biotin synthase